MIRDLLTLTSVQVAREAVTADGLGGFTTTTTLTTLSKSIIWQNAGSTRYISDKFSRVSTHILAVETGTYTWASTDTYIVYASDRYKISGPADNVFQTSELTIVGLELLT